MNFRMLKKKYRKMYGQNPPKWMKERLIKTMVSPSEYRAITAIGIKVNELRVDAGATRENAGKYFMRAIFTVVDELRKEMRQYERNTTNLVNTTRTLAHTKDKVEGAILGEYSTEEKTVRVLCAIQVAAQHPEKIRIFNMPSDAEVVL